MPTRGQRRSSTANSIAALSKNNLTEIDDVPAYIIDLCKTEESNNSDQKQRRGPRRVYGRGLAQSFTADIVTKRSGHKVSRAMSGSQSDDNGKENQDYDLAENDLLPSRQSSNIGLTITAMDKPATVTTATATVTTKTLPSTLKSALTPSRRRTKRSLEENAVPSVEPTTPSRIIEPSSSSTTTNLLSDLFNNNDGDAEQEDAAANTYHIGASSSRFFLARGGSNLTSNNTMASLPPLERSEFSALIQQYQSNHQSEMMQLQHLYSKQFKQWYFELRSGFSLLIYGYGSKRQLTHRFAREMLTDAPLIVVNGFSPIVSPKEIIEKITSVLPDAARSAGTLLDQARHITEYLAEIRKKPMTTCKSAQMSFKHIYLLIHNIECSGLQSERARAVLATLVKSPSIYCVATVDHIHSGFLWDSSSMAQFKWLAHDGTTFEPYLVETSYDNVLLAKSEEMDGKAARYVLASLTVNARGLFRLLADYQLKFKGQKANVNRAIPTRPVGRGRPRKSTTNHSNEENNDENDVENDVTGQSMTFGLSYSRFYAMAKESFLVSNDLTFRTQLTEFRDHRLMLTKRSSEGEDLFYIPFSEVTLTSLVQTIDSL